MQSINKYDCYETWRYIYVSLGPTWLPPGRWGLLSNYWAFSWFKTFTRARCIISRANCVCSYRSLIISDKDLCTWRNLDTLTCYYLLISLEIHPHRERKRHSHSIKIVLVASVDIKISARGLLASITPQ